MFTYGIFTMRVAEKVMFVLERGGLWHVYVCIVCMHG